MRLLVIDTALGACTAAVFEDGGTGPGQRGAERQQQRAVDHHDVQGAGHVQGQHEMAQRQQLLEAVAADQAGDQAEGAQRGHLQHEAGDLDHHVAGLAHQLARRLVRIRRDQVRRQHEARRLAPGAGLKARSIQPHRLVQVVGREMAGEGIGQPQRRGEARPIQRRPEDPDRHVGALAGMRGHRDALAFRAEIGQQLDHVVRKVVVAPHAAAQRVHHRAVAARRAAQTKVDARSVDGGQRAERLGHRQGCVVRQHDPAGAHADRAGVVGDVADQHRGRGAGDARHVVVFGQPVALVALRLGRLRQRELLDARPHPGLHRRGVGGVDDGAVPTLGPQREGLVIGPAAARPRGRRRRRRRRPRAAPPPSAARPRC